LGKFAKSSAFKAYRVLRIKGFTLIELLVVIGLIGILASALFLLIDPATQTKKARDTQRKSDVRQIQSALELYRSDVGSYPIASLLSSCGVSLTADVNGSTNTYVSKIPCDPVTNQPYFYVPDATGTLYALTACLEYTKDTQQDRPPNGSCSSSSGVSYTVNSP